MKFSKINLASPNSLEAITSPIRNEDQIAIIGELRNLEKIYLSFAYRAPLLSEKYVTHVTKLRRLTCIHIEDLENFGLDHFENIVNSCPFLVDFGFPRGTKWAEEDFLSCIAKSRVREISPWSYIGGETEGQRLGAYEIRLTCFTRNNFVYERNKQSDKVHR